MIEIQEEEGDATQYPEFDFWQLLGREKCLVNHQQGVHRYDGQRYGVEQNFKWSWHY